MGKRDTTTQIPLGNCHFDRSRSEATRSGGTCFSSSPHNRVVILRQRSPRLCRGLPTKDLCNGPGSTAAVNNSAFRSEQNTGCIRECSAPPLQPRCQPRTIRIRIFLIGASRDNTSVPFPRRGCTLPNIAHSEIKRGGAPVHLLISALNVVAIAVFLAIVVTAATAFLGRRAGYAAIALVIVA